MQKNDVLHAIAKLINDEQAKFADIKQKLIDNDADALECGKETIETLTIIYEAKRRMLEQLYKEIQSM